MARLVFGNMEFVIVAKGGDTFALLDSTASAKAFRHNHVPKQQYTAISAAAARQRYIHAAIRDKEIEGRARGLRGGALHRWIAGQVGCFMSEVKFVLSAAR